MLFPYSHSDGLFFSFCSGRCEKPRTSIVSSYKSILLIFSGSKPRLLVLDFLIWVFFHSPEKNLEKTFFFLFATFCSTVSVVIFHTHWSINFSTIFCSPFYKIGAIHSKRNPDVYQHMICIEYNKNTFYIHRSSQE